MTTSTERAAYAQALLEGVPLPATRGDLIRYARKQRDGVVESLRSLPSRRFTSLDEVGEELAPVQPKRTPQRRVPVPESDLPPGGRLYGVTR